MILHIVTIFYKKQISKEYTQIKQPFIAQPNNIIMEKMLKFKYFNICERVLWNK